MTQRASFHCGEEHEEDNTTDDRRRGWTGDDLRGPVPGDVAVTGERTAEEWGLLAKSLPGFRWLPGMRNGSARKGGRFADIRESHGQVLVSSFRDDGQYYWEEFYADSWPDVEDPGTAGCLLELLRPYDMSVHIMATGVDIDSCERGSGDFYARYSGKNLGCVCVAMAAALGKWPDGSDD